jgi:Helix-turn-helix domain of resolvase
MKVAKAKGRLRGKQPKLNHRQEAHLVALFDGGDHSTAKLADLFGVTRSTVYRAVERERARVGADLGGRVEYWLTVGSAVPQATPAGQQPALPPSPSRHRWPFRCRDGGRSIQHHRACCDAHAGRHRPGEGPLTL